MKLIKPDPERRVEIPGVGKPVQRPVDIDKSQMGFDKLRSLRIYLFEAGAIIDGHAEEDEVFVVVLKGSVEFAATGAPPLEEASAHFLSAPSQSQHSFCAAYLPPQAAYRLTAQVDSIVAYARATPASGNPPRAFQASGLIGSGKTTILLEENEYAQQLRLRLYHLSGVNFTPVPEPEAGCETLVHLQFSGSGRASADSVSIESGDTAAISGGECPTFHFSPECSALALVVQVS